MRQFPCPGEFLLRWTGDVLKVTLRLDAPCRGRAAFRTNLGHASVHRREVIDCTESGKAMLSRDWHDVPMHETAPGRFEVTVPLVEVGLFAGKACFFAEGSAVPQWPEGGDLRVKVEPAHTACANTVYCAFVRQFGEGLHRNPSDADTQPHEQALDARGYTVIPPSGTFRGLIRQLDHIQCAMRFRVVQLLPVFPVPTVYARMGRYGSAFAALDFLSVDPALAEFDTRATPMDQFRELVDAVHSRAGTLYLDLPANHTGWAATLQTHHPEWYRRTAEGAFASPGAWGVTWADLAELDYSDTRLRAYMADVFLFWCRQGVDGFRCDAGYMIPVETWAYIVARVREEYPDTVFLLEGLGGSVEATEALLSRANLNWAYSELFQTETRAAMEHYLPAAVALAERCGPLIHFAETHDNLRLAAQGPVHARMRTALAALLSHQGAFGIANGVEWFATEKIDVHGASALNWDNPDNQVAALTRLNALLATHPAFGVGVNLRMIQRGDGECVAVVRETLTDNDLLVLVNLDCSREQTVCWDSVAFPPAAVWDMLTGAAHTLGAAHVTLQPGQAVCFTYQAGDVARLDEALADASCREPDTLMRRRRDRMAMCTHLALSDKPVAETLALETEADTLGAAMTADPDAFCARTAGGFPRRTVWQWPEDTRREVMVPAGNVLLVRARHPFYATVKAGGRTLAADFAVPLDDGQWGVLMPVVPYQGGDGSAAERRTLDTVVYAPEGVCRDGSALLVLPPAGGARILTRLTGGQVAATDGVRVVLSNGAGAMAHMRVAWGEIRSQYDCILAVNPHPRVPVDKMIFWTRCRAWLNYCGYSQEINNTCLTQFDADPSGRAAAWRFTVPCGMGQWVSLLFRVEMVSGSNRARLVIRRLDEPLALDAHGEVTVILRPDIEWRDFHHKTKAAGALEAAWPAATALTPHGFMFTPADGEAFSIEADRGTYRQRPEWTYGVPHPEEQARGLDAAGDLYSPGWFEIPLAGGQETTLTASRQDNWDSNPASPTSPVSPMSLFEDLLSQALSLYVVRRDSLHTVIAGYPWFLDWGRDTLIALRGLIAGGRHRVALDILREFGRFERDGTIPNMIRGEDDANRETSDAPLWFCVAAGDLMAALGDEAVLGAMCGKHALREVLVSIVTHYRDGTPNGIRMDASSGLIYSPAHYTWMDTNYPAATPRQGYPVDIQALWIKALRLVAQKIDAPWGAVAEQAAESLARYFVTPEGWLADCLRASPGMAAADAEQEDALRPNQLLAVTLGILSNRETGKAILRACECLLVPGAIRSIADRPVKADMSVMRDGVLLNAPHHPYQGRYAGDEDTQRKPAYHNGTAWTWQFPLYVEALAMVYGAEARDTGLSLLGSSAGPINRGCLCHTPECCDGDAPHTNCGCGAQAWGMSELLRVWKKLDAMG